MPVYNTAAQNLLQAFFCIYKQKVVASFDFVIVDDGSDHPETLMALEMMAKYERVTVLRHEQRKGSSAARNTGISQISTPYIALMDSDDLCNAIRLKIQTAYIEANKPDILGTNLFSFYDGDINMTRIFKTKHLEVPEYNNGWLVNQGTVMFRKEAVLAVGGYNEKLMRGQDIDLWKRLYLEGYKFRNITDVMYAWRRYKQ